VGMMISEKIWSSWSERSSSSRPLPAVKIS